MPRLPRTETEFDGFRWQLQIDVQTQLVEVWRSRFRGLDMGLLVEVAVCFWNGEHLALRESCAGGDALSPRHMRDLSQVVHTILAS